MMRSMKSIALLLTLLVLSLQLENSSAQVNAVQCERHEYDYRFVLFVENVSKFGEIDKDGERWKATEAFIRDMHTFYWGFLDKSAPCQYKLSVSVVPFDSRAYDNDGEGGKDGWRPVAFTRPQGNTDSNWHEISSESYRDSPDVFDTKLTEWTARFPKNDINHSNYGNYPDTLVALEALLDEGNVNESTQTQLVVMYLGTGLACKNPTCNDGGADLNDFEAKLKPQINQRTIWQSKYGLELGASMKMHLLPIYVGNFSKYAWESRPLIKNAVEIWGDTSPRELTNEACPIDGKLPTMCADEFLPTMRGIFDRVWTTSPIAAPLPFQVYEVSSGGLVLSSNKRTEGNRYKIPTGLRRIVVAAHGLNTSNPNAVGSPMRADSFNNPDGTEINIKVSSNAQSENRAGKAFVFVYEEKLDCPMEIKINDQKIGENGLYRAYQYEVVTVESTCGDYPRLDSLGFELTLTSESQPDKSEKMGDLLPYKNEDGSTKLQLRFGLANLQGTYTVKFSPKPDGNPLGAGFSAPTLKLEVQPSELVINERCENSLLWPKDAIDVSPWIQVTIPQGGRIPIFSGIEAKVSVNDAEHDIVVEYGSSSTSDTPMPYRVTFPLPVADVPTEAPIDQSQIIYEFEISILGQPLNVPKCTVEVIGLELVPENIASGEATYTLAEGKSNFSFTFKTTPNQEDTPLREYLGKLKLKYVVSDLDSGQKVAEYEMSLLNYDSTPSVYLDDMLNYVNNNLSSGKFKLEYEVRYGSTDELIYKGKSLTIRIE